MRRLQIISAALALSISHFAHAKLTFVQAEQEVVPTAAQKQDKSATQQFAFTNTGSAPVTIKAIRASDGCTAELPKKTYLPGEQGTVVVTSEVDPTVGPQRNTVVLETDDADQPAVRLVTHVNLPHPVEFSGAVSWAVGEAKTPKVIKVTVNYETPIRLLSVKSSDPLLSVQLSTILDGQSYAVTVTPASTDEAVSAVIDVETDLLSKGRPRVLRTGAGVVVVAPPPQEP